MRDSLMLENRVFSGTIKRDVCPSDESAGMTKRAVWCDCMASREISL